MSKNSAASSSKNLIDLTDDSEPMTTGKKTALQEMASLRARNRQLEHDNAKLKTKLRVTEDELSVTRESLGKVVVDMRRMKSAGSLKRVRSASPEKVKLELKLEELPCKLEPEASPSSSKRPRVDDSSSNPSMERRHVSGTSLKKEESVVAPKTKSEDKFLFEQLYDSVRSHLKSARTLVIQPPFFNTRIHRQSFCHHYHVNSQHFLGYLRIGKEVLRRFVFPMLEMNPILPTSPGEPGLIFASRHEILENPPWTLFVKVNPKREGAVWTYMGEYECVICGRLDTEEFCFLSDTVKRRWAEFLLEQQLDVYLSMRVRIALRKANIIPIDDKDEEKNAIDQEKLAVKRAAKERAPKPRISTAAAKGKHGASAKASAISTKAVGNYPINEDDIINAFLKGEEWIDIIRLECTSYDYVFAQELQHRFNEGPPSNHAAAGSNQGSSKQPRKPATRGPKLASSQRPTSNESDSEMDEAESLPGSDGEVDFRDELVQRPAGPSDSGKSLRRSTRKRTANHKFVDTDDEHDDIYE